MFVTKEFHFDSAHQLPNYDGLCAYMHGHRWTLRVTIDGPVMPTSGMVIDFKLLSSELAPLIKLLDHTNLNTILRNPTCENLTNYIAAWLCKHTTLSWTTIELFESPDSYTTLHTKDFDRETNRIN